MGTRHHAHGINSVFFGVTHLVLGVSLLGFSLGAVLARRLDKHTTITPFSIATIILIPPSWWMLSHHDLAWGIGLFSVPFITFGEASTVAWKRMNGQHNRSALYLGESIGTVFGLVILGPLITSFVPINVLGEVGFDNHLRTLVAKEGIQEHQQVTTAYATTDLIRTQREDTVYLFTDAMFVSRAVAWDGNSSHFFI